MLKRIEYCCYDIGSAVLICSNLEVSWYCLTIEIIDIESYSYLFSVKILSPQNGGFIRAFWLVPDSYTENIARLRGVRLFFLSSKVYRKIKIRDFTWKNVSWKHYIISTTVLIWHKQNYYINQ